MHPSLKIEQPSIEKTINPNFTRLILADDCEFTEGPIWNKDGYYLFSDINANTIYTIKEGTAKEVYCTNSGTTNIHAEGIRPDHAGSNGLTYDKEGVLLACQHGNHSVARWENNSLHPFITTYKERPLNSPNDLVVDKKGRIFFSDPPYGLKDGKPAPERFQFMAAVYCWEKGALQVVCDKYQYPNGVCITPDGKELYICSNKTFESFISIYDVETLQYKGVLANENSDGIKCDPQGHVYLCNKEGIIILDKQGQRLALITLPTIPANICWGGAEEKDLLVTARENVFLLKGLLL